MHVLLASRASPRVVFNRLEHKQFVFRDQIEFCNSKLPQKYLKICFVFKCEHCKCDCYGARLRPWHSGQTNFATPVSDGENVHLVELHSLFCSLYCWFLVMRDTNKSWGCQYMLHQGWKTVISQTGSHKVKWWWLSYQRVSFVVRVDYHEQI